MILEAAKVAGGLRGLGFDEFMDLALYHPEHGYYSSGKARIGTRSGGDFYTNVSVGSIYGEILAGQIVETWRQLGSPGHFHIFEQGANDGQLMADILQALQQEHEILPSIRAGIIESNPLLENLQKEKLSPWTGIVDWISTEDFRTVECGFYLANELLDAFPFALAEFSDAVWRERIVRLDPGGQPSWDVREPAPWLRARIRDLPVPRHAPFLIEIPRDLPSWAERTARLMGRGVILLCDYGFSEEELFSKPRPEGTYQCYSGHKRDTNPLERIGDKDITAHVNFTEVDRRLSSTGCHTLAFLDQHHFLIGAATNWLQRIERDGVTAQYQKQLRQLQTLIHPDTMGTQFHFLAAGKDLPPEFSLSGLRHRGNANLHHPQPLPEPV